MTNEFAVIGYRHDDAEDLLLLGGDGRRYHYHLTDNHLERVYATEGWVLHADATSSPPVSDKEPPGHAGR